MRILRVIAYLLAGVVVLVAIAFGVVYFKSNARLEKRHAVQARTLLVPDNPEAITLGRHLAVTRGCTDCHGPDFAGAPVITDAMVGQLHGPNLTRGRGGLPADYSDADYVRAIRHGVARDGRALVLMPSAEYTTLSDEDLGALIAYLKTVKPVDKDRGPVSPGPILRMLLLTGEVKLGAEEINHAARQPVSVPVATTREYGAYLANSCTGCHGPNLSGGKIPGAPPDWPMAANLTPHASARLKDWTEKDFFTALRTHQRPDGSAIDKVMPAAFGQMKDVELTALWLYLKSLPAAATAAR